MTGTSAGSVNAALGAVEWLLERPGSVWNNALFAGWIDLDIEAMVPELIGRSGRREPDDAVTLRAALAPTVRVFLETVAHGRTRHGQVDVGVAVTRLDPPSRTRDGLTTRAAREIVLVRMTADEDGAGIRLDQRPVPGAGRRLLLPTTTGGEVAPTALVDAIHASTAFPFVFGAVALEGALRDRPCGSLDDCLEGELERAWYVDGGVFDPAPIHSAVALLEGGDRQEPASGVPPAGRGDMHYVFVDPARTRRDWPTPGQTRDLTPLSEAQRPGAMTSLLLVVSSMRAATSDTELEALLRHHRFSSPSGRATEHGRQLHVLSRGFPTVGIQAFWFAGLFDRTFRVFDYLVGVYDGLVFAAASQCSSGDADSEHADSEHADGEHDGREHQGGALEPLVTETSACEVRALRRLHDVVGLGVDDPATRLASWMVRSLAAWEYGPVCVEVAGRWCQPDRAPGHAVGALFEALRPRDADASSGQLAPTRGLVARLMAEDGTSTLMARYREALAARGLSIEDGAEGPFGRAFIEDPEQAFRLLVSVMANVAVQRDAASDIDRTERGLARSLARGVALVADRELRDHTDGLRADPSSIPWWTSSAWRLAPWAIDAGTFDPTLRALWRPTWYRGRYGIGAPVNTYLSVAPLRGNASVGLAPFIWRTRRAGLSELEVSVSQALIPNGAQPWSLGDGMVVETAAYLLQSRLRVGVACGVGQPDASPLGPARCTVRIGLSDLPGFFHHISRR